MEKIAWVTGATGFWGRNVTLSLLRLGWQVVALTRAEPTQLLAWATSQGQHCRWVRFDLNTPDWDTIATLEPPHALFHCAVAWEDTIEPLLQANVATPIHLISFTLTQMQALDSGRIGVFLGQNGRLGLPNLGHFSATQAALWTWAEATSRELTTSPTLSLSLVFPPRAPSDLQTTLASRLVKPPKLKRPPTADRLVRGVLSGQRRVGRRPWLAALATLVW